MKWKLIAIIIAGIVGIAGIATGIYFGVNLTTTPPLIQSPNIFVTVIWDEPKDYVNPIASIEGGYEQEYINGSYLKCSQKPDYIEIYKGFNPYDCYYCLGGDVPHPPQGQWILDSFIELEYNENGLYTGYINLEYDYDEDIDYIVKVPKYYNEVDYRDTVTCFLLNKSKEFNEIKIHWWSTFTKSVEINTTVIWDEPANDSSFNPVGTEPDHIQVCLWPSSYYFVCWWAAMPVIGEFNLTKINNSTYNCEFSLNCRSDFMYFIRSPYTRAFYDNITIVWIDTTKEFHNVTIHYWQWVSSARKPAIYLYNLQNDVFTETLSVHMPFGFATITIPEVELSDTIIWDSFEVFPGSQILYNDIFYPYLFYEAEIFSDFGKIDYGWVIKKIADIYIINDKSFTKNQLLNYLSYALLDLGLFENEIDEFINYWFFEQELLKEDGTHILQQMSSEWVNNNFQLSTIQTYSQLRLFFKYFYSEGTNLNLKIQNPVSNVMVSNTDYILHEWGVII